MAIKSARTASQVGSVSTAASRAVYSHCSRFCLRCYVGSVAVWCRSAPPKDRGVALPSASGRSAKKHPRGIGKPAPPGVPKRSCTTRSRRRAEEVTSMVLRLAAVGHLAVVLRPYPH
jgi:hypothetical protein